MSDNGSRQCLIFNGELRPGATREHALEQLHHLTNLPQDELLDALFSIKPVIINCVESQELVDSYLRAFEDAGLVVTAEDWNEEHEEIINAELSFGHYAPKERIEQQPNFLIDVQGDVGIEHPSRKASLGAGSASESRLEKCLVFSGAINTELSKYQVVENLSRLTDVTADRVIEEIFSIVPVIVFRHDDPSQLEEYLGIFSAAGLELDLRNASECTDILAESQLRIRQDKPQPLPQKQLKPFSMSLAGLVLLGILAWGYVHLNADGFLRSEPATTINIELAPQPIMPESQPAAVSQSKLADEAVADTESEAKPEPEPELKLKPKHKPAASQQKTLPAAQQTPSVTSAAPTATKTAEQIEIKSESQRQAEENYYMHLLSWFARPEHQSYDAKTRALNLEGEIEVAITIARDGTLLEIDILRSTSAELTRITRETAERASPYPKIPKDILGENYRFKLPLKYTLKD